MNTKNKNSRNRNSLTRNSNQAIRRSRTNSVPTPAQSVENGIKILKLALKKNISASAASLQSNRGKNYISAIRTKIQQNRENKFISNDLYKEFKSLFSEYERSSR